jgi:hypothetical protein
VPTPVCVVTSSRYQWALRPFGYLFERYWSQLQPVTVITDARLEFALPSSFSVFKVGGGKLLPAKQWSDALLTYLDQLPQSHFILMLEDYWLIRTVDHRGVETLSDYARAHGDVLRVDLTDDRQYNGKAKDIGAWGHYDLVETPGDSEYQMSLQAGIWSRDLMRSVLRPGLSPWEVELHLGPALHGRTDLRVIGSRQPCIRYINVFKSGKGFELQSLDRLPTEHLEELRRRGWLRGG